MDETFAAARGEEGGRCSFQNPFPAPCFRPRISDILASGVSAREVQWLYAIRPALSLKFLELDILCLLYNKVTFGMKRM